VEAHVQRVVVYTLVVILGFFGLVFVVGAQGQWVRVVVGVVLWLAAGALIYLTRVQPQPSQTTVVQKIDLSGNVNLEQMKCKSCGGALTDKSITVKAGAIFVHCEYCGATYQIEEEPKW
jgi:hypothetical protein